MKHTFPTLLLAAIVAIAWNVSTSASTAASSPASPAPAAQGGWNTGATGALGPALFGDPGEMFIDLRTTGDYDDANWRVVLDYQSFTIEAGTIVKFINHPSRAPVVIRATGPIVIEGELNLDGAQGHDRNELPTFAEPGPGGFRGGTGYVGQHGARSDGFGPGGGTFQGAFQSGLATAGGSHATLGHVVNSNVSSGPTYGNTSMAALIGGSGGTGTRLYSTVQNPDYGGGGGGGGAVLIGSDSSIHISGVISARGGLGALNSGVNDQPFNHAGSGGGIRMASPVITWSAVTDGSGRPNLIADDGGFQNTALEGLGRIRVETAGPIAGGDIPSIPIADSVETLPEFLPSGLPTVTIAQWYDESTSTWIDMAQDPRAVIDDTGVDVKLPTSGVHTLRIEGRGVPADAVLHVRTTYTQGAAVIDSSHLMDEVPGAPPGAFWADVQVDFSPGISTVQVRAEF